mmetsp:Transcript_3109/g.4794  ORF Transcript_3109/g.4794 Transcript_3109/m.4794 type:complete len:328 (-) Transcript_3109:92-1075(-)
MHLQLILVVVYFSGSVVGSVCTDKESCLDVHLNHTNFLRLLSSRCSFNSIPNLAKRRVVFTHIPKAGGSNVLSVLNKHYRRRHRNDGHTHFLVALDTPFNNTNGDPIFATLFRNPVDLAVSFYNYANGRKKIPAHLKNNRIWLKTFKTDPVKWAKDSDIWDHMNQIFLRQFVSTITNITSTISSYDQWLVVQKMSTEKKNVKMWIDGLSAQLYVRYTAAMPEQYRCVDFLNVAVLLLRRYSAVGVLERLEEFYKVFFLRTEAALDVSAVTSHSASKLSNKSKQKMRPSVLEEVKAIFQSQLFCSTLLWHMASSISHTDAMCYNTSAT